MSWLLLAAVLSLPDDAAVLTNIPGKDPYYAVMQRALTASRTEHPITFSKPEEALGELRAIKPNTVLVVVRPETIDYQISDFRKKGTVVELLASPQ